jgi:hypothetical protein
VIEIIAQCAPQIPLSSSIQYSAAGVFITGVCDYWMPACAGMTKKE